MRRVLWSIIVLASCTKAEPVPAESAPIAVAQVTRVDSVPAVTPPPPTKPSKPAPKPRVELTAVTLADDCGGAAPRPPVRGVTASKSSEMDTEEAPAPGARARGARRCEQTSMQLAIIVPSGTSATKVRVKSVKLFDDAGTLVGTLTARKPTVWSTKTSTYEAWNESVAASGTLNVSYVLSQPAWSRVQDRWNKTFTLKVVVSVGGVDQATEKEVTASASTSLPPNVRT